MGNTSRETDKQLAFWCFHFLDLFSKIFFFNIQTLRGVHYLGLLRSVDEECPGKHHNQRQQWGQSWWPGTAPGVPKRCLQGNIKTSCVYSISGTLSSAPNPECQDPTVVSYQHGTMGCEMLLWWKKHNCKTTGLKSVRKLKSSKGGSPGGRGAHWTYFLGSELPWQSSTWI